MTLPLLLGDGGEGGGGGGGVPVSTGTQLLLFLLGSTGSSSPEEPPPVVVVPAASGSDGYTYVPNSKSAEKIRKLLFPDGNPNEFEQPAKAASVELEWPEGYRVRQPRVLPPKPEPKFKWWGDAPLRNWWEKDN
jgi:hypothetical protein